MNRFLALFFAICAASGFAQNPEPPKDATLIQNIQGWCSQEAGFKTNSLSNQPESPCGKMVLDYGHWFKFQATTTNIEIELNIGGKHGTMRFPYLALWDADMNNMQCMPYADEAAPLTFTRTDLKPGNWYYIQVNNHNNSKYVGTFTLCVNDVLSYDFFEGAYELTDISDWCSPEGAFTTLGATPDNKKAACLTNGPNFNRWFKFQATTSYIKATVKKSGGEGNFDFPYLALMDANQRAIKCAQYINESTPVSVEYNNLTVGNWYYLSVDHQFNLKYRGSFSLCVDNGRASKMRAKLVNISGRLFYLDSRIGSGNIELLDDKGVTVHTTPADAKGKFYFNNLDAQDAFMLKVEEEDPDLIVDAYQTDEEGNILKKGVKTADNTYEFKEPMAPLHYVTLVEPAQFKIDVEEGKNGLIGKVVQKSDPADGIEGFQVEVYSGTKKRLASTQTDQTGRFAFDDLPADENLLVKAAKDDPNSYMEMMVLNDKEQPIFASTSRDKDAEGYFHFRKLPPIAAEMATMQAEDVGMELPTDFSNLESGRTVKLNNLYFEFGKYTLLDRSYTELNELAKLMKDQPGLAIEIQGHTDNTGAEDANQKLSETRARIVADYLISTGIDKSRVAFKGFGSSQPVQSNATKSGRKANRRVEFKVLRK